MRSATHKKNSAPWSMSWPLDRPLTKQDIQGHEAILPFHGRDDSTYVMCVDDRLCSVLAYLVPQTGHTSRLLFAWALMAPLIQIKDVSIVLPLTALAGVIDDYDPTSQVVMLESDLADDVIFDSGVVFRDFKHPIMLPSGPGAIVRICPSEVAVAPIDTPIHAFSADLHDFPRI